MAVGRSLPGVRLDSETQPWPPLSARPGPASSANSGGDYVACRRTLLNKYASRWMLALHDQGPVFYSEVIYELVIELTEELRKDDNVQLVDARPGDSDETVRIACLRFF